MALWWWLQQQHKPVQHSSSWRSWSLSLLGTCRPSLNCQQLQRAPVYLLPLLLLGHTTFKAYVLLAHQAVQ
jgi:hypothetical protein